MKAGAFFDQGVGELSTGVSLGKSVRVSVGIGVGVSEGVRVSVGIGVGVAVGSASDRWIFFSAWPPLSPCMDKRRVISPLGTLLKSQEYTLVAEGTGVFTLSIKVVQLPGSVQIGRASCRERV
jgi:hypothetical protein